MASLKPHTYNLWSEMFAPRKAHESTSGGMGPANRHALKELSKESINASLNYAGSEI